MATLLIGNDMRLYFAGRGCLKDEKSEPVTGATVEVMLYESDGSTEVSIDGDTTWPVTLSEGEEEGEYYGILPADAEFSAGRRYVMDITATAPGGAKANWRESITAEYRSM